MAIAVVCLAAGHSSFLEGAKGQLGALREHMPDIDHVLMVEKGSFTPDDYEDLQAGGWKVKLVPPIRAYGDYKAARWKYTFTTFNVWNLLEYSKVVFLDLDAMPVDDCMPLFDFPDFSATAAKEGYHRFSSGVMVLEPRRDKFEGILNYIKPYPEHTVGAQFGDQGILNCYFSTLGDPRFNYLPPIWNWKYWKVLPTPSIKIAHIRPVPWSKLKPYPRMATYTEQWKGYRKQWTS